MYFWCYVTRCLRRLFLLTEAEVPTGFQNNKRALRLYYHYTMGDLTKSMPSSSYRTDATMEGVYLDDEDDDKKTSSDDCFSKDIRKSKEIIILNVGGTRFQCLKSNFACWPTTRLSKLVRAQTEAEILKLCDGYGETDRNQKEFFFNRNWTSFNSILDIYRCGKLHELNHACAMTFHDDLEYWGIDELFLDPCCALKYYPERETCQKEMEGEKISKEKEDRRKKEEDFGQSLIGRTRSALWNLLEYPETSFGARVILLCTTFKTETLDCCTA